MNTIATVVTAATVTDLTTLQRVKEELGVTDSTHDGLLGAKIAEASSDIEAHLGRSLARETIEQRYWGGIGTRRVLLLDRTPVVSVSSVLLDGDAVDDDEIRIDKEVGALYRITPDGYADAWVWCRDVRVTYEAGYLLPGQANRNLPHAIEAAAVELLTGYWASRGRDPTVRVEDIPGVIRREYWVGAVGEAGQLPPGVVAKLAPFRRATVA